MARASRPITVTLGDLHERVEARVKSGNYASVSEVLRAAVRALEREEAAVTDWLRQRVDEAFAAGAQAMRRALPALQELIDRRSELAPPQCMNFRLDDGLAI